jgi:excinuclease UvrABC nuclease subunit
MWPREVLRHKDGKKLLAKEEEALQKPGVYILYREDEPYYIGKATSLFTRLHAHANKMTDRYYPFWTYFSAFAFEERSLELKKRISEIEGILIAAMPRAVNSSTPRWEKHRIPKNIRSSIRNAEAPRTMAARAGS